MKNTDFIPMKIPLYAHFRSFCDNSTGSSFKKPCSCSWISSSSSMGFSWRRSTNSIKRRRMASTKHTSGNSSTDRQNSSPRLRASLRSRCSTARNMYRVNTMETCAVIASYERERQSFSKRRKLLHTLKNTSMPQRLP